MDLLYGSRNTEEVKSMTDSHLSTRKKTIMVVDDNPDLVDIIRLTIESNGFNVRSANSGIELFAALEKEKPDLILLDVMMPDMDGFEVLTRLKSDPGTGSIPVILLTAKVQYEDVLGGYKLGADYYMTKPYTGPQLLTGINRLLEMPDAPPSSPIASA
jgi:CheY-like chemotaxis protein